MAVVQRRCEPNISLVSRGQSNARLKARPHLLRIHRLTLFAPSIVDDSETQAVTVMIAGQLMNSDHGLYPHSGPKTNEPRLSSRRLMKVSRCVVGRQLRSFVLK